MGKRKEILPGGDGLKVEGSPEGGRINRRKFLSLGCMALVSMSIPRGVPALAAVRDRSLSFYNTHTGERLDACYSRGGAYLPEALARIDFILRDHRSGEVMPIDPRLLDLLYLLRGSLRTSEPFHVISGYRSPATNTALRKRSGGVAGRSLHLEGKAIDIRVPGIGTTALRDAALKLKGGGVGCYPGPAFVHVDVGRVRRWGG